jgi:hypothetical protein
MEKMTFRETMILSEARKSNLSYKEIVAKNKIDQKPIRKVYLTRKNITPRN